jgi:hypothetical protein
MGLNLGLHFLSGAFAYDPSVSKLDPLLASRIVWLDSFITNVDRSFRNTNLLSWHKELWLIDHGSCLYFQYSRGIREKKATEPFQYIKEHVLLPQASMMEEADRISREMINENLLREIVEIIPGEWLTWGTDNESPEQLRDIYLTFLLERLNYSKHFVKEAQDARKKVI